MPRRGTCRRPATSPAASPPRARGTTSSRARRQRSSACWGPGFATFQYPNNQRESTLWYHDHALGMTRLNVYAGPAGFFLSVGDRRRQGRPGQPHRHPAVLPGPAPNEGTVPAQQDLLRDPDRSPGPLVQRRRLAVLPGHAGVLRRDRRRLHPGRRVLADLESRVLRQHDHGERQHLAVPDGRAAPLPAAVPQRLPVALPDPGLRRHPRRRGLADRQRGRLPGRAGEPDRRPTATGCSWAWPSGPT